MVRAAAAVAVLAACGSGGGTTIDGGSDGPVHGNVDAPGDPLVGVGSVELVQGGFQFVEGPQWREADGDLVFSDIDGNTVYRYVPGAGPPTALRTPSNHSNGLAIDAAGALLAAEHGSRSVTRTTGAGTTTIADTFEGHRLNSPNDVITADVDGTIYFTDPPYGITDPQRELDFIGVFRIDAGGTLTAEYRGPLTDRPNGIAIDPDHQRVYVADTDDGHVFAFPINGDGSLGARQPTATTSGNPDGMAVDLGGNLFVATATGIEVFAPDGTRFGVIAVPEQPANCAFGDPDHRTLYITARTGLYRVRLAHPGLPRN